MNDVILCHWCKQDCQDQDENQDFFLKNQDQDFISQDKKDKTETKTSRSVKWFNITRLNKMYMYAVDRYSTGTKAKFVIVCDRS